jgi:hypothetical protein
MSATAIPMSGTTAGTAEKSMFEGLGQWAKDAGADLWKSRAFSMPNMIVNVAQHGFRKGMERQWEQMKDGAGAMVRSVGRVGAVAAIITTKGAATGKVALASNLIKDATGHEMLPSEVTGIVSIGSRDGAKAAATAAASDIVNKDWLKSRRESAAAEASARTKLTSTPFGRRV